MAYFAVEFICTDGPANTIVSVDRRSGPFRTKKEATKDLREKGYRPISGPVCGSEPGTLVHEHNYWTADEDGDADAELVQE
ncbi:MAG: hypothetical protein AAB780_00985 [Patescibacteria group bacterium]